MAEASVPEPEVVESNTAGDMAVENSEPAQVPTVKLPSNGESKQKRAREDDKEDDISKKRRKKKKKNKKVEVEEEEALLVGKEEKNKKPSGPVKLGFKGFDSSLEMFNYFFNFLHAWPPYLNVNKYEHAMLLELLKNGHTEPDQKIGRGVRAFQVRKHPMWKSRCFFLIREDESVDDFSFRKCVDHILCLPEEMQVKHDVNKALGGSGGGAKRHGVKGGGGRGDGGKDGGGRGCGRGRR